MMMGTHVAFAILAALIFEPFLNTGNIALYIGLVAFGTLLPDVDHKNSTINKILPLTKWFSYFFKHRGFFHSIFPILIIYGIFWFFDLQFVGIALSLGYMTHLVSDSLTKMGVNFLYPVSKFKIQGFIETNTILELVTFVIVIGLIVANVYF